ncbi:rhomboid family protein [Planoprotostelium fungivorum]|uniref:Rhomboid family protein n=1 Tax=Planoprotostelium fungivorum TaxID=1890364 RepID=A0A2P6NDB6_9EUKA|nr:rhomboid family protein [Planoprotostelium fungivorum]
MTQQTSIDVNRAGNEDDVTVLKLLLQNLRFGFRMCMGMDYNADICAQYGFTLHNTNMMLHCWSRLSPLKLKAPLHKCLPIRQPSASIWTASRPLASASLHTHLPKTFNTLPLQNSPKMVDTTTIFRLKDETNKGGMMQMFVRHYYRPQYNRNTGSYGYKEDEEPTQGGWSFGGGGRSREESTKYMIYAIIAANVVIWVLWQGEDKRTMARNFLLSYANVVQGRPYTILTSIFSHLDIIHLILNMYGLYAFGLPMALLLGQKTFLALYFAGGILGSIFHLVECVLRRRDTPALGASGSILAVTTLFACLFPFSQIILLFVPLPAIAALGLIICYDLYSALYRRNTHTAHAAHLGGITVGILYFLARTASFSDRCNACSHLFWVLGSVGAGVTIILMVAILYLSSVQSRLQERQVYVAKVDEDVSWTREVVAHTNIITKKKELDSIFCPTNGGYEASSYLYVIIENYDHLPPRMAFTHGHKKSYHHQGQMQDLLNNADNWKHDEYYSLNWLKYCHQPNITTGQELQVATYQFWMAFMKPHGYGDPYNICTPCCAQFIITRENVQRNSRQFYQDIYDWLRGLKNETAPLPENRLSSRVLEYMWAPIFGARSEGETGKKENRNSMDLSRRYSKGAALLAKCGGWSEGKGLGKDENGRKDFVRIDLKKNTAGIGVATAAWENWWEKGADAAFQKGKKDTSYSSSSEDESDHSSGKECKKKRKKVEASSDESSSEEEKKKKKKRKKSQASSSEEEEEKKDKKKKKKKADSSSDEEEEKVVKKIIKTKTTKKTKVVISNTEKSISESEEKQVDIFEKCGRRQTCIGSSYNQSGKMRRLELQEQAFATKKL